MNLRENLHRRIKATGSPQNLSSEEGFLISRLGSELRLSDLLPLCPWPEEQALRLVDALISRGLLQWMDAPQPKSTGEDASVSDILNADENDPELRALERDLRRLILVKTQAIDSLNPYDLLDVSRNASTQEIRNAYLKLSKKFHPDRFFRRQLGHYKDRLDLLFARIQKAYATLKDPHEREALNRIAKSEASSAPKHERSKEDKLRSIRALNPTLEKTSKAEKYYQDGQQLQRANDYVAAYNAYALASQICPEKDQYRKAYEDSKPLMLKAKAQDRLEAAKRSFDLRLWDEMYEASHEALKYDAALHEASLYFARAVLELGRDEDYKLAKERMVRAKAGMKSTESALLLGRILLALGEKRSAKKEFEEVLKREPKNQAAQKLLDES